MKYLEKKLELNRRFEYEWWSVDPENTGVLFGKERVCNNKGIIEVIVIEECDPSLCVW